MRRLITFGVTVQPGQGQRGTTMKLRREVLNEGRGVVGEDRDEVWDRIGWWGRGRDIRGVE